MSDLPFDDPFYQNNNNKVFVYHGITLINKIVDDILQEIGYTNNMIYVNPGWNLGAIFEKTELLNIDKNDTHSVKVNKINNFIATVTKYGKIFGKNGIQKNEVVLRWPVPMRQDYGLRKVTNGFSADKKNKISYYGGNIYYKYKKYKQKYWNLSSK